MPSSSSVIYLRVEGVNLSRFVFDTRDLSTIRGGGLALLLAVDFAHGQLDKSLGQDRVELLSKGASIGLFEVSLSDDVSADDLENRLRQALQNEYPFATFVVDSVHKKEVFQDDAERVLARNRWRQMQSPTLSIPGAAQQSPVQTPACAYDGIRPAEMRCPGPRNEGKPILLSPATDERNKFGRRQRDRFYRNITKSDFPPSPRKMAREFEHIAADPREPLNGKLAVFYADGNRFGATQRELCTSPEKQKQWDEFIRQRRAQMMRAFLQEIAADDRGWVNPNADGERYRFETLLWGGDELLFVMPAWKGWRFAERFFAWTGGWDTQEADLGSRMLTHTAALVFCHHHSPIHRIKALAKEKMADAAKDLEIGGKKIGRERNQLVYQILESVDHVGADLSEAIGTRYKGKLKLDDLVLEPNQVAALAEGIATLKALDLPRTQLRHLVNRALVDPGSSNIAEDARQVSRTAKPGCLAALEKLAASFVDPAASAQNLLRANGGADARAISPHDERARPQAVLTFWVHLEELWDYAAPSSP